jgi:hypothetical protein
VAQSYATREPSGHHLDVVDKPETAFVSKIASSQDLSVLKEESLHTPRFHHSLEAIATERKLIHQANVVHVVREVSTALRQAAQTSQIHLHALSKVCCVDHRHGNSAVAVHEPRDVDVHSTTACIHTHGAGTREAEVACKRPQVGGGVVGVAVEAN